MSFIFSLLLAVGLSMDSFSVSFVNGLTVRKISKLYCGFIALIFAFIQSLLFSIGWMLGSSIHQIFQKIDHWIAFGILLIIGLKMIFDSDYKVKFVYPKIYVIVLQGLATSIDAIIVGVGIGGIVNKVLSIALIIAAATFIFSFTGALLGKHIGKHLKFNTSIIGGIILIIIGLKILVDHLLHNI